MTIGTTAMGELAAEIRPGVLRPDWSAVTRLAARGALAGRMAARSGLAERWSHALAAEEDFVWRTVLRQYANLGRAPRVGEIAVDTDLPIERVAVVLRRLQEFDLVGLEPETDRLRYAYPFTETASGHRVDLNGNTLNALCAIDALGVGAMYRMDVSVVSRCRQCGEGINFATANAGRALRSLAPAGAVVWYDFAYQGSASDSCCPAIAFFCGDEHLRRWLDAQTPRREGARLDIDEALEVGRAIFGPVLREPVASA
jgi:alkylmercury lyase